MQKFASVTFDATMARVEIHASHLRRGFCLLLHWWWNSYFL